MLITQITFFINCANALLNLHQAGTLLQKRQVETFLKTWFFYNSASQEIYWTGKTSVEVQNGAPAVTEHWYIGRKKHTVSDHYPPQSQGC
jgi:hypothetical protein